MHGYTEHFDFNTGSIKGWVYDKEAEDNRKVIIRAHFDKELIGESHPTSTRPDLEAMSSQYMAFAMTSSRNFTALDVASGRLIVSAHHGNNEIVLGCTQAGDKVLRRNAARQLWVDPDERSKTVPQPAWSETDILKVKANVDAGFMSSVVLPVGLLSQDGSAMIGAGGNLFLVEGTNTLFAQYRPNYMYGTASVDNMVDLWESIFADRQYRAAGFGVRFIQTIIPEKLTVMKESAPVPIEGPTILFQELEKRLTQQPAYISGLTPFIEWTGNHAPYLQADTHFSAMGAQSMFGHLLDRIDMKAATLVRGISMDTLRYGTGDLTGRFSGIPIHSEIYEPSLMQVAPFAAGLQVTKRYFPSSGFVGRSFAWKNSTAPSALKILVFGNSFFGGGDEPGQLSWWAKHFFREFRIEWNPDFDWKVVEEFQPDIVIGQTVERFLARAPKA